MKQVDDWKIPPTGGIGEGIVERIVFTEFVAVPLLVLLPYSVAGSSVLDIYIFSQYYESTIE